MTQRSTQTVSAPIELQALSHPTRVAILEALAEPSSAADAARRIGQPRQLVNYHLKALEEAGLAVRVQERRKGNFVEVLYQASARGFIVAPDATWGPERLGAFREQHALGTLVDLGLRIQQDATALIGRSGRAETPSATVIAELRFPDEASRAAFFDAYLEAVNDLVERYSTSDGDPFRAVMAVYPDGHEDGGI
jgi:DNA-binding transcriptional ArsR family regulator